MLEKWELGGKGHGDRIRLESKQGKQPIEKHGKFHQVGRSRAGKKRCEVHNWRPRHCTGKLARCSATKIPPEMTATGAVGDR